MSGEATGLTVTFTPFLPSTQEFLFVRRALTDEHLPGWWCFPGGRVEMGETLGVAIRREAEEETALKLTGRARLLDSYLLGSRVGLHFLVECASAEFALGPDLGEAVWLRSIDDLGRFGPRIAGIDNHVDIMVRRLRKCAAETVSNQCVCFWDDLDQYDLLAEKFLNRK